MHNGIGADQMLGVEEISELKRARHSLEKSMEKIEKSQRPTVVKLSERLKELMGGIETVQEKEKSEWNPALITRIRFAKKGMKLSKELSYFEMEMAGEFERGNISKDTGKRFVSILRLIKENKILPAKKEFGYFEEIIELSKKCEKAEEEMREKDRTLRKERLRIEKVLEEMSGLEKEAVDMEKVRRHEELMKNLERLEGMRAAYLHSIACEPVVEMLGDIEKYSLKDYHQDFPGKEEMEKLKGFFSDYPAFGKYNASQLCEFFGYSEKKLSHVCPETTRFRKVVMGNKKLFETIRSIEQTAFLAVDNELVMDFFAEKIGGAREVVERVRQLGKEKYSYREEYEKSRRIEKRKEELSKYSKKELEEELRGIDRLLGLLNSDRLEEDTGEKRGPLAGFLSFLRGA
jgi:hypothetical protein